MESRVIKIRKYRKRIIGIVIATIWYVLALFSDVILLKDYVISTLVLIITIIVLIHRRSLHLPIKVEISGKQIDIYSKFLCFTTKFSAKRNEAAVEYYCFSEKPENSYLSIHKVGTKYGLRFIRRILSEDDMIWLINTLLINEYIVKRIDCIDNKRQISVINKPVITDTLEHAQKMSPT